LDWALDRFEGSFQPLARTEVERKASGYPRPSLESRYSSREDFVEKTEAAASAAVAEHLLLPEDKARLVDAQAERFHQFVATTG
jgi:hypothetical protein